jgi:hypothetical protein
MLKLKDEVSLEKLRDYGFILDASKIIGIGTLDFSDCFVDDNFGYLVHEDNNILIDDYTRIIEFDVFIDINEQMNVVFDLINDGLVEKVKEN